MKFIKKIIKFLFTFTFLLLLFSGILTGVIYKMKPEKLPFQNFAKKNLYYSIFPDSAALAVIDSALTPEEVLAIEIDSRRKLLDDREQQLMENEVVVNTRLDSVKIIREQLQGLEQQKTDLENERIAKLVKMFESMRAQEAAKVMNELNDRTIVDMLQAMADRQAAKILQELDPVRAAEISQRLTRVR